MRKGLLSEAFAVVRPILVFLLVAGAVTVFAALKGWATATFLMVGVLALTGALLILQVHRAVSGLSRRSAVIAQAANEAEWHYVDVLRRIVNFIESRDPYLIEHSDRVGRLARKIAQEMRLPVEECDAIALAGCLHDLGMIGVRPDILAHGARLSLESYRCVQKHPSLARQILEPLRCLRDVLPSIVHHHERMNGTGYPAGISGETIPLGARVLAVADAYDAMIHDRPQRDGLSPLAALQELQRCTPSGYDGQCVAALAKSLNLSALQKESRIASRESRIAG